MTAKTNKAYTMRTDLTGPDFLDLLSQTELSNGLSINAHEYAKRSREWRDDLESGRVARDAVELLSSEMDKLRRSALQAHDALSLVRPHSENLDDYTAARTTLAALADIPLGPPAWSTEASGSTPRDPRASPMPGDRFYLPVEVHYANYGPGIEVATTLIPLVDGQRLAATFHVYALQHAWLQGAIGIVPAANTQPLPAAIAA